MPFVVTLAGELRAHYDDLESKAEADTLDKDEERLFKKLRKALRFLSADPRHPGLDSHDIDPLSKRFKRKVWQSDLDRGDFRLFRRTENFFSTIAHHP